jgi:DNA helicase HerA-like ATPase
VLGADRKSKKRHGITAAALVDWETHVVGRFSVQNVRDAGGGVIAAEDYGDPVLGKVHGLVRTQSPGMKAWSELRSKLLDRVQNIGRTAAAPHR